ncbi:uncharacterized protein MEPE_01048 [Melanopsichium pennsylvanicum]|uniref:Uncharacterized protein n=2 Tax=Melanopsichium pennsylvanicum TaxID=63383 RepID=A0AAJ4XHE2_9BASI|nr:protein fam63a [Melanopsichium pennsylvanicum 4]SNX82342.1 uncharacterized protein MEPE_01048 [Melanopsichium pennsylvanicum]
MVKITSAAAAGAVVFAAAVAATPIINTPASITQCNPASLQWSSAEGTVRLFILPAGEVSATPLQNLPDQTGASGSYVWTVDVASGTNITIAISDGTGTTNYASPLVVLAGTDSSCLSASSSSSSGSASSTASSSTAAAAASTSSRASSSAVSSSSSAAASSSRDTSSSRATSSASSTTRADTSSTSSAAAKTSSAAATNAAAAFSPATAGLSVIALAGALLPFL